MSEATVNSNPPFEGWAILELMGHRVRYGHVSEVEMFGGKLLRIDIPVNGEPDADHISEFYSCGSVYSLRPASEQIIRDQIKRYGEDLRPVRPADYRERPALTHPEIDDYEGDQL